MRGFRAFFKPRVHGAQELAVQTGRAKSQNPGNHVHVQVTMSVHRVGSSQSRSRRRVRFGSRYVILRRPRAYIEYLFAERSRARRIRAMLI